MVAANSQRWLTSAENDQEAWKCILLARSLRRSLTTRLTGIFISDQVSGELREKLQDEFDVCTGIGEKKRQQYHPGLPFHSVAKLCAWNIRGIRKFVFLDCNSLVVKNSDKLFRKNGIRLMEGSDKICLFIGNVLENVDVLEKEIILQWDNSKKRLSTVFPKLETCYGVTLNHEKPCSTPITGDEWKIVCFPHHHPMDTELVQRTEKDLGFSQKFIIDYMKKLLPERSQTGHELRTITPIPNFNQADLSDSIAIVGMACRFPGANTVDDFWKLLEAGQEGIIRVPDHRWTKENSLIRLNNVRNTEAGFLACPIDKFDAKFFNTNAADMASMDPQQRLTLQIVWEGLEHAGIDPESLKNSLTGVFGGWWRNDYKEMLQQVGIINETDFFRTYMGNALGTLTARISHFFEFVGPSVSTESGCSTSIVGVDMACDNLKREKCDVALAVGANLLLHPFTQNLMNSVISMDGRCKTFDTEADGFGRAEGVAALVLKRYPDAVANGDRIWGLIRGSAVVQEGTSKSMGTPTVESEALAMELALERAGVEPKDVSFVETHGTGTPVGDPLEIAAVAKVYSKGRTEVLTVGSVKTNIGHTESVCGIAGIMKTVLSMKHELIPKHLNFNNLNHDINLTVIPAQLPLQAIQWKKRIDGKPRIAGVSSFGITGTDAHVIVQETPDQLKMLSLPESRLLKIFLFSGKSEESLKLQMKAYRDFLPTTSLSLEDIEFTQHTGRSHFNFRKTLLCTTKEELIKDIDAEIDTSFEKLKPVNTQSTRKTCFLFTGQGSQYPGMAKSLYDSSIVFQSHFDHCESLLNKHHGFCLKDALWGSNIELLKRTLYSQTSIFCVEYCLLKLWESWGIKPDTVVGHSLGEFSAAVAAGILSFEDALLLVVNRSKLIDALPNASMLVVGGTLKVVEQLLKQASTGNNMWLDVAAVNSNEQTVLAGPTEHVQKFAQFCQNNNLKFHVLDSSHAFHSRLMDPMLEKYEDIASKISYSEPNSTCKFISGMEGQFKTQVNSDYWVQHTRDRVRFMEASETALKDENLVFLEIGPHPVLSAMIMINSDSVDIDEPITCIPSLRKKTNDWDTILSSLGKLYNMGFQINWDNFHRFSSAKKVDLPGYVFDEKRYWLSVQDDGTIPFHPLLGGYLPNPSTTKVFKNDISLFRVPFLKDHTLGDKVIFPGAGYIEMCLTAGFAATCCPEGRYSKPNSGVCIRNFSIETPAALSEKISTEFQVIVSKSTDSGDPLSTVYTKVYTDSNNFKWVRHASANFQSSPVPNNETLSLESIKARCTDLVCSKFDYKALGELGYNFGPTFQLLGGAWTAPVADKKSQNEFLLEFSCEESVEPFTIHPCIIDAMMQAQMITKLKTMRKNTKLITVPLQVENFTCWAPLQCQSGYIHLISSNSSNDEFEAQLFDQNGQLIATMMGTEFVDTTLNNILALIEAQRNPYPGMGEFLWRESLGPYEKRISKDAFSTITFRDLDPEKYNSFTPEQADFFYTFNELCALYMIQALKKLGMDDLMTINKTIQWPDIGKKLGVLPGLYKFLRYFLEELSKDGWLELTENSTLQTDFKIKKLFPDDGTISTKIQFLESDIRRKQVGVRDLNCVVPTSEKLAEVLTGEVSALNILFPEGANFRGPAEAFYHDSLYTDLSLNLVHVTMEAFLAQTAQLPGDKQCVGKPVIRILEVGAGTGCATTILIPYLKANNLVAEYTYTDISKVFLNKGEEIFQNTGITTELKILDIEQDPMEQGFRPGYYDLIVACYVVHATRDIEQSMKQLVKLLSPNGYILLIELTELYRGTNLLFGGLDQFWGFNDETLRPYHCQMPVEKWEHVLSKYGFVDIHTLNSFHSTNALFFARLDPSAHIWSDTKTLDICSQEIRTKYPTWAVFVNDNDPMSDQFVLKLSQTGRKVVALKHADFRRHQTLEKDIQKALTETFNNSSCSPEGIAYLWGLNDKLNYQQICEPYLYVNKFMSTSSTILGVRVIAFTKGNMNVGGVSDSIFCRPDPTPIQGMTIATMNEIPGSFTKCVDMDPSSRDDSNIVFEAIVELFATSDQETMVAYRHNRRHVPRLQYFKSKNTALSIPFSRRFQMILPTSHMISDLKFAPLKPENVGDNEIEIEVKAYALNFRDLMIVLQPDKIFETMTTVGIDYAGVITAVGPKPNHSWKIGDKVTGARYDGVPMSSHFVTKGQNAFKLPDRMTYGDGATLPVAYTTVNKCFIEIAKIKEGDVVLIHTGSGGVGLAAIVVAQWNKCTIVATAGSERKRNYLRSLGVEHVFNSRTTEYEHDIRKALGGRGVDVVLNTLTGVGFKEASLAVCAPNARFIEISKMNVWSKQDVHELRPDVMYEIADLTGLDDDALNKEFKSIKDLLDEREAKPLPYTKFDLTEIREAFEYMQRAKHVGKIVITMPEYTNSSSDAEPKFNLFNENATYLVTGGLGGIGLEVGKWMSCNGAKHILLVGRNPPTKEVEEQLDEVRSRGIDVIVRLCDVGKFEECKKLFDEINDSRGAYPPLRGIMHSAGVLADGTLDTQTWEQYEAVFNPKIKGSWNLHQLTLDLRYPLEHFVMYSSLAAIFGSIGQSNHAAGNVYMDSLVHYRNSMGLPGITINWGPWGQVGVAANLTITGMTPFTVLQGLTALESVLKSQRTHIMVCEGNIDIARKGFSSTKKLLSEIQEDVKDQLEELDGDEFWKEYDATDSREQKCDVVRKYIKTILRINLKMDKSEVIDDHANFQDIGMDSLMMVEMKNSLQTSVGKRVKLSIAAVKDSKTVDQLATTLVELMSGKQEIPPPTPEELRELIKLDSILPDNISATTSKIKQLKPLSKISTVLITGATGTLGPYVVVEILKRSSIQKVYCLMRENKLFSPLERFKRIFKNKNLLQFIDLNKIEFILGDASEENLGMSEENYTKLAQDVEAIFHLAVKASMDEFYTISEDPKHSRNVNLPGMLNMLSFSVEQRLKYVYHASTLIAEMRAGSDGRCREDWPTEGDFDNQINSAYPISKYVCDRLASQAVERGIPCKAFRFPNIGGDSVQGGNFQILDSHLMVRIMAYMYMGLMPAHNFPVQIFPVDLCAKFSVELFFNEDTGFEMFNVTNPDAYDEREFDDMAEEFGVKVDVIEPDEFFEKIKTSDSSEGIMQVLGLAAARGNLIEQYQDNLPEVLIHWLRNKNLSQFFLSRKLCKFLPKQYPQIMKSTEEILRRDLQYAKDTGIFDKAGIKYTDSL